MGTNALTCKQHDWKETGRRALHVDGNLFKYGNKLATYVRCSVCRQLGFRFAPRQVVYTWKRNVASGNSKA